MNHFQPIKQYNIPVLLNTFMTEYDTCYIDYRENFHPVINGECGDIGNEAVDAFIKASMEDSLHPTLTIMDKFTGCKLRFTSAKDKNGNVKTFMRAELY